MLQAKHVAAPDRSCSDRDFDRLLKDDHPKIRRLIAAKICDHYMVFTNRKLTGGCDEKLIPALSALGLKTVHIIGTERLHLALDDYADIRETLPNREDSVPFRFNPDDLNEVIHALHDYTADDHSTTFDSAKDFEAIKIREQKNKINNLSDTYYREVIVNNSMPHFARVEDFLKNPRNIAIANLYHDSADELKQKILLHRTDFDTFDNIFGFLYEEIQRRREVLKGKRRLVSILLHYMYFNCDIGSKDLSVAGVSVDARA